MAVRPSPDLLGRGGASATTEGLRPGLVVLQGNRLELLGEAVFEWLRRAPLAPLEEEVFLVQSNAVAEWLKMGLATHAGICAATRVELPGRFLWRAYRQVLGREQVPPRSAMDKLPLAWRLMRLLPELVERTGFEPLAAFVRQGGAIDPLRRLQLADRLADLYDQYQVYRSDWLAGWAAGEDLLPRLPAADGQAPGQAAPLPADQRWQAELWRELLAGLDPAQRSAIRPQLHRRFLQRLDAAPAGSLAGARLARRVVLFGATQLPMQTLQALGALSRHCQVLLAIPNPCRFHWADIIAGRELLRGAGRRQPLRQGVDLAALDLDQMHAHAHPLLAAWGRQGRDFVRQLDAFAAGSAEHEIAAAEIALFDAGTGQTLLEQVQARIRDLVPLAEHTPPDAMPHGAGPAAAADRSIVFHIAHSAQREVEILHDQLLELLDPAAADRPGPPLRPRDIVVMVPDIETFAPAIRSVFGRYPRSDPRCIPWDIADLRERGSNPLLVALEWLLRLPQQRFRLSEIRDLLDVPAIAARFGLDPADLPQLQAWMTGAGVRWGLDAAQRSALGLGACGTQNSWDFGLDRMLLGYACGMADGPADSSGIGDAAFQGIEPYGEVGGLDAAIVGSLASLIHSLRAWATLASTPTTPAGWALRIRALCADFVAAADERDRLTIAALEKSLAEGLEAADAAGFEEAIPLAVARETCLAAIDAPAASRRFRAGGVTFCSLLPMRSIPFEVVCLLGMNDGDYPRAGVRSDFDLMGLPGLARPGDRSRRDDDRQLMLEALLSARRVLYLSWSGRSERDNSRQPPSVLVSQLRDYLAAGWGSPVLAVRTTEHPLQPFSRRYFEEPAEPLAASPVEPLAEGAVDASVPAGLDPARRPPAEPAVGASPARLFTHAIEWRTAHGIAPDTDPGADFSASPAVDAGDPGLQALPPAFTQDPALPLTVAALVRFLRHPVKEFFRLRLNVVFDEEAPLDDDESFAVGALEEYGLLDEIADAVLVVEALAPAPAAAAAGGADLPLRARIESQAARLRRAGRLPIGEIGSRTESHLVDELSPMLEHWLAWRQRLAIPAERQRLDFEYDGIRIEDWLDGLRISPGPAPGPELTRLERFSGRLAEGRGTKGKNGQNGQIAKGRLRPDRLISPWVHMLVASACGHRLAGVLVGRDASALWQPLTQEEAARHLVTLLHVWREGMSSPLPLASRTALAAQAGGDARATYEGHRGASGEVDEPCLARLFPDLASLVADGRFEVLAGHLFGPLLEWAEGHVTLSWHADAGEAGDARATAEAGAAAEAFAAADAGAGAESAEASA